MQIQIQNQIQTQTQTQMHCTMWLAIIISRPSYLLSACSNSWFSLSHSSHHQHHHHRNNLNLHLNFNLHPNYSNRCEQPPPHTCALLVAVPA